MSYPQGKTGTQMCPSTTTPQGHKGHIGTQGFLFCPSVLPCGPLAKTPVRDTRDTSNTPTTQAYVNKWTTGKSTPLVLHVMLIKDLVSLVSLTAEVIHRGRP